MTVRVIFMLSSGKNKLNLNFIIKSSIMTALCWELKNNNQYCKNYKLKNHSKCSRHLKVHSKSTIYVTFITLFTLITLTVYYISYHHQNENNQLIDQIIKDNLQIIYNSDIHDRIVCYLYNFYNHYNTTYV